VESGEGVSPPTGRGLGRELYPSPEIFGSKWPIFVQFFFAFRQKGVVPPPKYARATTSLAKHYCHMLM